MDSLPYNKSLFLHPPQKRPTPSSDKKKTNNNPTQYKAIPPTSVKKKLNKRSHLLMFLSKLQYVFKKQKSLKNNKATQRWVGSSWFSLKKNVVDEPSTRRNFCKELWSVNKKLKKMYMHYQNTIVFRKILHTWPCLRRSSPHFSQDQWSLLDTHSTQDNGSFTWTIPPTIIL